MNEPISQEIDKRLEGVREGFLKLKIIISFCQVNYSTIQEKTFFYIKKGLQIARKNKLEKEINILQTYFAFYLLHHEQRKKAIAVCKSIIPNLLKNKSYLEYGLTIIILSQIEWAGGNLENAFNLVNKSIDDLKYKRKKQAALVQLHWILGVFYFDLNELEQSFHNYEKSHFNCDESTNIGMLAYIKIGLASVFFKTKQLNKASIHFQETLVLSQKNDLWLVESRCYYELGIIEKAKKNYTKAIYSIGQSYIIRKANNAIPASVSSLVTLAQISFDLGDFEEAEAKLTKALDICIERKLKSKKAAIFSLFSKIYEAENKFELAFKYLKKYNELEKEINKNQTNNKFKFFKLNYKAQRAQKESAIQRGLYNKLKKSNYIINKQKDSLALRNQEKEILLKEIHHRVKNNLQIITSLLSLQSQIIEKEETKELFRNSQFRINSMALIHEMLYQSHNLSKINYFEYLDQLIHELVSSYKGNSHNVRIEINVPDIYLNVDTAIPLGLMINEIVTNSLKYAFMDDNPGILRIEIKKLEENQYLLEIGDNGQGYSPDLNYRKLNSLGLKLIYKLAKQISGQINRNYQKKGTHYVLIFEDIRQAFPEPAQKI